MPQQRRSRDDLDLEQLCAISRALKLGSILQEDLPEIAEAYRQGDSYEAILTQFGICQRYRVTETVGHTALYRALHGFPGGFGDIDPYVGLLRNDEKQPLLRLHRARHGARIGTLMSALGKGIHSMTPEEYRAVQQRGNATQRRLRLGIYGLSLEERQRNGALGAAKAKAMGVGNVFGVPKEERIAKLLQAVPASIEARDLVPWTREETQQAYALWTHPDYKRTQPPKPGHPDLERIAQAINMLHHQGQPVRNKTSIDLAVRKYRKKEGIF